MSAHEVWAIDTWKDHVDAINAKGLRVEGASGDRTVHEGDDQRGRRRAVRPRHHRHQGRRRRGGGQAGVAIAKPDAPILTIQNGLGSADKVAAVVGEAHHDRRRRRLRRVDEGARSRASQRHGVPAPRRDGRRHDASVSKTGRRDLAVRRLQGADLRRHPQDDLGKADLQHDLFGAVRDDRLDDRRGAGQSARLGDRAARATEAFDVARAKGVKLDFTDVVAYVKAFGEKIPGARPSMLLDHMAGRRPEIDNINGAIPREGRTVGVPTPVNDTLVALVKAKESTFGKRT